MRLCVPNIPAVVSFSLGAIFVAAAGLFHWLGPVCGRYDFVMAINVFFGELAHGGWAVLFVLSGLLHFMLSPQWSGRGPILRSFLISSLISLFIYYGWGHHQPWWSCLAMVSAIFLGLLRVGFFVFVKFLLVAFFGYLIFGYSFTLLKASVFLRGVSFDGALASLDRRLFGVDLYKVGGFKSEVQHLQPCKVRRCKAPQDTTSNFSLKSA